MSLCYNPRDSIGGPKPLDSLTHTLTGLALSRAGLNRFSSRATLVAVVAANLPDIDIITAAGGSLNYLEYHRGITHSLMAMPWLAVIPVFLAKAFSRHDTKWLGCYLVSLMGVASHLLLDCANIYGVRLLAPFRADWFRLDALNIVDIWVWAALLLSVFAPALARLVSTEIGAPRRSPYPGQGSPIAALLFLAFYGFGHSLLHSRAVALLDARAYQDRVPLRTAAFPGPANPLRWTGLVETADLYQLIDINLLRDFDPAAGRILYKRPVEPPIQVARSNRVFRVYFDFAQYPFWTLESIPDPEGWVRVSASDLRFGSPPERRFTATAVLDGQLRVQRAWFEFGVRR